MALRQPACPSTTFGVVPTFAEVERKDFRVNAAPDVELAIREVWKTEAERNGPPIVLVHGARVPGIASFDLPVEGGSLAADLATRGYQVFIVDARGYGRSDRPGQDGPPEGRPLTHSNEVARDIDAAVEAIRDRTDSRQVGLLGWATGGHWAGMYASLNRRRWRPIRHLAIGSQLHSAPLPGQWKTASILPPAGSFGTLHRLPHAC
ncbi:alpha/beta hydrolase [Rhizobium mongolense]|uniref:alpha/beta hydrolase n=1 Tax=Rhizobium mongolense TaxID=57676 RepID=UPI003557BF7D